MQWDDTSFYPSDPGGLSDWGTSDVSSYDTSVPDLQTPMGALTAPDIPNLQLNTPLGTGSAAPGAGPGQNPLGFLGGLGSLGGAQGLLGLGGGLAGIIGALTGGGVTGTTTPQLPTAARAQIGQANQALQPFALGQTPLQMQQAGMLQALAQGQVPPGFAQLVANAYDPAYQNAATRATNAARQAGFYDNPLSSPVGGAIMGPAAAQLQGQQANSLLGLLQTLPGLFNQPISSQIGAAQGQSGNLLQAANLQRGQQQSVPLGSQIGQAVGGGLQGMSQAIGQQNQQQMLGQLLQNQFQGQSPINTGTMYPGA